jgi:hypothetical protein
MYIQMQYLVVLTQNSDFRISLFKENSELLQFNIIYYLVVFTENTDFQISSIYFVIPRELKLLLVS